MPKEKTVVAISKVGSQNRVYFPNSLLKKLNLKKGDKVIFLRTGELKPKAGATIIAKLEDKIKR